MPARRNRTRAVEGGFERRPGAAGRADDGTVRDDAPADEGGGGIRVANAGDAPLELMILGGAPAEGPLVFHGPFVMNSVEQARAAEIAFRTGRMGALAAAA